MDTIDRVVQTLSHGSFPFALERPLERQSARASRLYAAESHRRHQRMSRRQHDAALISLSVQSSLRLIATFLEACRQALPCGLMASHVRGTRELGCVTFDLAVEQGLIGGQLRSDWVRCLDDLAGLANSLSCGTNLTRWELVHALDTLVALSVQLDATARERAAGGRKRTLAPRSSAHGKARSPGHASRNTTRPSPGREEQSS